jgi:glycosyltransferase involved in cell wall biosynthesis
MSRDVVFSFAYASWGTSVARGMCFSEDRMVQTLLAHPDVRRLIVAETPRSLPIKVVKDLFRPQPSFPADERASLYSPLRLRRADPVRVPALERAFRAWDARARRTAARRGLERPAVIVTHPLIAGFAPLEWSESVTFYAYDDLAASPRLQRLRPAFEEAYRRIRQRRIAVAAVSEAIVEKIQPEGPSAVVPNAVDPVEWESPGPPPRWFAALPGPRLLYVGSLESRIDVDALERAARARPDCSIALVGPLLEPSHFERLRREPNVHLHPPASREEVVALVVAADACLIPHLDNALTESMSPLKLYEYLAGGAPVAASDLRTVRGISPRVAVDGDFVRAIDRALALGRAPGKERRRFAEANSWRARQARIVEMALAAD